MVNRIVTGAHYGLTDWLAQRVTAVVMAAYTVIAFLMVATGGTLGHAGLKALFAPQWFRILTLLFVASLLWHAWVGVRDILMDYIQPTGVRLSLQVLVILTLAIYGFWALAILFR